jgi:hypothetical protein
MHYRAIPWVLFSMRISGWLYYKDDQTTLWDNSAMNTASNYGPPRPRVAAALIREGMEVGKLLLLSIVFVCLVFFLLILQTQDYEYLYAANCRRTPLIFEQAQADIVANGIGFLFASFRVSGEDDLATLRNELGFYLEGTRPDMPFLVQPKLFPFGSYFLDFAPDPTHVNPTFPFGGQTWMKVDFSQNFDIATGIGFQSAQMGLKNWVQAPNDIFHCQSTGSGNVIEDTVCFNDFNQNDQFHMSLAPGTYSVTVAVGWPGATRNGDIEYVEVNDVILRNFTCGTAPGTCASVREFTQTVTIKSHGPGGQLISKS